MDCHVVVLQYCKCHWWPDESSVEVYFGGHTSWCSSCCVLWLRLSTCHQPYFICHSWLTWMEAKDHSLQNLHPVCTIDVPFLIVQFGISADIMAFKEWSKLMPARTSGVPSHSPSSLSSVRNTLSRTSSCYLLSCDDSDDSMMMGFESSLPHHIGCSSIPFPVLPARMTMR